jgi:hypothetical protein
MQFLLKFQWHFPEILFKSPNICMEPQKTLNNQSTQARTAKLEPHTT